MNNKGENSPVGNQALKPILAPVTTTGRTTTTQAPSIISTIAMSIMPMYGLLPSFVPLAATQAQMSTALGVITTTFQNPLYTNTIMANLPPFRPLLGPSVGLGQNVGNTLIGPIFPTMPRLMQLTTPSYTNESLATF